MIIAKVKRVIFENDGYYVLLTDQGNVVLTSGQVEEGKTYKFNGNKSAHPKYGKQFKAESAEPWKPQRSLPAHEQEFVKKFAIHN